MPSLARSMLMPLKVPSLTRSAPKPLKEPSLARSVPKPLKVPTVITPEIRQNKGPNWRAEPVLVSQKLLVPNNLCHTFVSITDTNFKWTLVNTKLFFFVIGEKKPDHNKLGSNVYCLLLT